MSDLNEQLLDAVSRNDLLKAQDLIKKGADVNFKNTFGETPLTWASFWNNREMIELLFKNGADANAKQKMNVEKRLYCVHVIKDILKLLNYYLNMAKNKIKNFLKQYGARK